MAVDKNLFLYDVAVAAIMKNEAPYAKEWLDYHILAGVNHFYIYDNDSPDNLKEILKPYIDAGVVTYKFYPGKARQYEAYNETILNYRFSSRYIAFIDADEFIFPQNNKSVPEVVNELLKDKPNAGGLAVNIYAFGSNNLEKADYSKGVLERFTRRAPVDYTPLFKGTNLPGGTAHVSTIANPRRVNFFFNPHFAVYFEGFHAVNEKGGAVTNFFNNPPTVDKIVMNHYSNKSFEEWQNKMKRGTADAYHNIYNVEKFKAEDNNEVFDDAILKYRAARMSGGYGYVAPIDYQRCYSALLQQMSPTFVKNAPIDKFAGKLETFLTCRKLAETLRQNILDADVGKFFEEAALKAVYRTLYTRLTLPETRLLISELPNILPLDYPIVKELRKACVILIPQIMNVFRVYDANAWREFANLKYITELLKLGAD